MVQTRSSDIKEAPAVTQDNEGAEDDEEGGDKIGEKETAEDKPGEDEGGDDDQGGDVEAAEDEEERRDTEGPGEVVTEEPAAGSALEDEEPAAGSALEDKPDTSGDEEEGAGEGGEAAQKEPAKESGNRDTQGDDGDSEAEGTLSEPGENEPESPSEKEKVEPTHGKGVSIAAVQDDNVHNEAREAEQSSKYRSCHEKKTSHDVDFLIEVGTLEGSTDEERKRMELLEKVLQQVDRSGEGLSRGIYNERSHCVEYNGRTSHALETAMKVTTDLADGYQFHNRVAAFGPKETVSTKAIGCPFLLYLHTEETEADSVPVSMCVNHRRVDANKVNQEKDLEAEICTANATVEIDKATFQSRTVYIVPYIPVEELEDESKSVSFGSLSNFKYMPAGACDALFVPSKLYRRGAMTVRQQDVRFLAWLLRLDQKKLGYDRSTHCFDWNEYFHVFQYCFPHLGSSITDTNEFLKHVGAPFRYKEKTRMAVVNRHFKRFYQSLTPIRFAAYDGAHKMELANRIFNGNTMGDQFPLTLPDNSLKVDAHSTLVMHMDFDICTLRSSDYFTEKDLVMFTLNSAKLQELSEKSFRQGWTAQWRKVFEAVVSKHFLGNVKTYSMSELFVMSTSDLDDAVGDLPMKIAKTVIEQFCQIPVRQQDPDNPIGVKDDKEFTSHLKHVPKNAGGLNFKPVPDVLNEDGVFKATKFSSMFFNKKRNSKRVKNDEKHRLATNLAIHALLSVVPFMCIANETRQTLNDFVYSTHEVILNPCRVLHFQVIPTNTFTQHVSEFVSRVLEKSKTERGARKKKIMFLTKLAYMNDIMRTVATGGYKEKWNGFTYKDVRYDTVKALCTNAKPMEFAATEADDRVTNLVQAAILTHSTLPNNLDIDRLKLISSTGKLSDKKLRQLRIMQDEDTGYFDLLDFRGLLVRHLDTYLQDMKDGKEHGLNQHAARVLKLSICDDKSLPQRKLLRILHDVTPTDPIPPTSETATLPEQPKVDVDPKEPKVTTKRRKRANSEDQTKGKKKQRASPKDTTMRAPEEVDADEKGPDDLFLHTYESLEDFIDGHYDFLRDNKSLRKQADHINFYVNRADDEVIKKIMDAKLKHDADDEVVQRIMDAKLKDDEEE